MELVKTFPEQGRGPYEVALRAPCAGQGNFVKVSTVPEIAYAFTQVFRRWRPEKASSIPQVVRKCIDDGRRLSNLLTGCKSLADIVPVIVSVTRRPPRV